MGVIAAERSRPRVQSYERLGDIAGGQSRLQVLHPTGKIVRPQPESFRRDDLMRIMLPQAVGIVLDDGNAYPIEEHGDQQIVVINGRAQTLATFDIVTPEGNIGYHLNGLAPRIIAAKVIPVSTWGTDGAPADMMLNLRPEWQKFHESPDWVMAAHLNQRANTLQALFDRGEEVVYTGRITSPSSWRQNTVDEGGQTVMMFHDQGHVLSPDMNSKGPEGIRGYRRDSHWDSAYHEEESASRLICEPVAAYAKTLLKDKGYWLSAVVHTDDQYGFSVELPDYTLDDFRKSGKFLQAIFGAIDKQLRDAHGLIYASDLRDVEQFALGEQLRGEFDMAAYEHYFTRRTDHDGSPLAQILHSLAETEELRYGFGQVFSASFQRGGGAQFEFSTAVLRGIRGIGPNEMRGYKSERVSAATGVIQSGTVPREQVIENAVFLRDTVTPRR